jgi:hypothetical protein
MLRHAIFSYTSSKFGKSYMPSAMLISPTRNHRKNGQKIVKNMEHPGCQESSKMHKKLCEVCKLTLALMAEVRLAPCFFDSLVLHVVASWPNTWVRVELYVCLCKPQAPATIHVFLRASPLRSLAGQQKQWLTDRHADSIPKEAGWRGQPLFIGHRSDSPWNREVFYFHSITTKSILTFLFWWISEYCFPTPKPWMQSWASYF